MERFDNGNIKLKCEMKGEIQHGDCIAYFESGKISYISKYSNGELDGVSTFFHSNGVKHWEVNFKNGVKEGKISYYDSLERLYQTSEFKESILNGTSYEFYEDGSLKTKAEYHVGELNGQLLRYNAKGNVVYDSYYSAGVIQDYKEYDDLGLLVEEMLKYEISHAFRNDHVEIFMRLLNPKYSVMMVEFYVFEPDNSKDSNLEIKESLFSESGNIQYNMVIPQGEDSVNLVGFIYDMEPVNDGEEVVVKNKIKFSYPIVVSSGQQH